MQNNMIFPITNIMVIHIRPSYIYFVIVVPIGRSLMYATFSLQFDRASIDSVSGSHAR